MKDENEICPFPFKKGDINGDKMKQTRCMYLNRVKCCFTNNNVVKLVIHVVIYRDNEPKKSILFGTVRILEYDAVRTQWRYCLERFPWPI